VSEFDATVAWLHEKPLRPGARVLLKHGTRTTQAIVGAVTHRLDTESMTLVEEPGELGINDMGQVSLTVAEPLPLDDYDTVAATGSFLLIDPQAGDTLAAGLVGRPLVTTPLSGAVPA
jgi:sulfate adenylyltransferase subunit 1